MLINIKLPMFYTLLLPPSLGNFKKINRLKCLNLGIILSDHRLSKHRRQKDITYKLYNSFVRPWINSRKNKRKIWEMVERILFMLQNTEVRELIILTFWHRSFKFNSNKSPTWCNNSSAYYPDVCLQLSMFRAFFCPSSGAQWLQWQPLVLSSYRGDSRSVFVVGPAALYVKCE